MILYIHGFGSSGKGNKANILKEDLKKYNFFTPSLSFIPDLAIDTLEQIIEYALSKNEPVYLMGSSLGGYYSIYLSHKYNLKAILINPSIKPYETLKLALGKAFSYHDMSKFEWKEEHIKKLYPYDIQNINPNNFFLLTQTGDELLDYKIGVDKLQGANMNIIEGGDHGFVNIENHLDEIKSFFGLD
jgi:predicted esterase YcpF (UPF0227 family)